MTDTNSTPAPRRASRLGVAAVALVALRSLAAAVAGLAHQPTLASLGRMGIKALLYFEVVTTIALFLGLAAINLSRAGVGVTPPALLQPAGMTGQKQTAADAILNAFPENVAKAVAEGHVLQIVIFSIL